MIISGSKATCVYEVQQNLKHFSLQSEDLHLLFICLPHAPGEQSREVRAAGSEHQPVDPEDTAAHPQPHITEVCAEPHLVHLGQDESGVAVWGQQSLLRRLGCHGSCSITTTTTTSRCWHRGGRHGGWGRLPWRPVFPKPSSLYRAQNRPERHMRRPHNYQNTQRHTTLLCNNTQMRLYNQCNRYKNSFSWLSTLEQSYVITAYLTVIISGMKTHLTSPLARYANRQLSGVIFNNKMVNRDLTTLPLHHTLLTEN